MVYINTRSAFSLFPFAAFECIQDLWGIDLQIIYYLDVFAVALNVNPYSSGRYEGLIAILRTWVYD